MNLDFLLNKEHKTSGDQLIFKDCIYCGNSNWKFYVNKETGLHDCKICQETGNLYRLKKELMVEEKETNGIDYLKLHTKLMEGGPVLDYLVVDRHLAEDTIKHFQLGAADDNRLVIPFIINEKAVYWKVRYLEIPEGQSKYKNASKPVRLFNEAILKDKDIKELFIVEGEIDAMSLWQAGYKNVIAVPGAGIKKAEWLKYLDDVAKIYLIYDNDAAGQKGAKAIAQRIGIQKCYNVLLPEGKDINDLIANEEDATTLNKAIEQSEKFRLDGVYDAEELALTLAEEFETKGNQPTYVPDWWYLFGYKFGGYEPGDLIGVLAEAKSGKSSMCLNWAYQHAKKYKEPIAFICYEMGAKRVQRKLSAYLTQADDTFGKSELTPEKVRESIQIWHADGLTKDDLIIAEANGDVADVFTRIRDIVRIYGIKFLVFDNLHLLTRSEKEAQELNILGKKFKALATELNIPIVLILQPHRVQGNNLVTYKNIMGSSGPEKDVDTLVCINRVRILSNMNQDDLINMEDFEEVPLFEPEMYISIDLCRYGAGGRCKLYFDGARSTVKECTEVKPEMKVFNNQVEQI